MNSIIKVRAVPRTDWPRCVDVKLCGDVENFDRLTSALVTYANHLKCSYAGIYFKSIYSTCRNIEFSFHKDKIAKEFADTISGPVSTKLRKSA